MLYPPHDNSIRIHRLKWNTLMRPSALIYPAPIAPRSTTYISAQQEKCKNFCCRLSKMHSLEDLHPRLHPIFSSSRGGSGAGSGFYEEDKCVLFEAVRVFVEKKLRIVALDFRRHIVIRNVTVRCRESFSLPNNDLWMKLHCKP